jgi:hypothetical protein
MNDVQDNDCTAAAGSAAQNIVYYMVVLIRKGNEILVFYPIPGFLYSLI